AGVPSSLIPHPSSYSRVKILDFGLARLSSEAGQLTQSGAIVGTPAYMAPEQARGQAVDARSDLFSLGAVLYRMATGRTPFSGSDTMSVLMSLATDTPEHPLRLNPGLPPALADLIVRLLQKDPAKRPQSAREVIGLLAPPEVETLPADAERRAEFDFDAADVTETGVPLAAPAEPEAFRSPKRKRGRGLTPVGIAVAVLASVGIGVGTYKLVFETKDGTLVVEVNDTDVAAVFKNGELQILDAKGEVGYALKPGAKHRLAVAPGEYHIAQGDYRIRVTRPDGLTLETDKFEMKKSETVTVRVTARPPSRIARADGPASAKAAAPEVALAGDRPPPKDLFPGELVAYETFDSPSADWPPAKLPAGVKCVVADGVLRTEFPNKEYDFGHMFGRPATNVGFAVRLRTTNAGAFVNFAFRRAAKSDSWLMFTLLRTGGWTLHQVVAGAQPDQPARERVLLAEATAASPDLAAGQWVGLSGRVVGNRFDVWANGRSLCSGSMTGPAGAPKPDAGGLEIGPVLNSPDPARLEIDYVAVWNLSAAKSNVFRNGLGMEFARVPKGKAWLGGGGSKPGDREVEVKDDFFLGVYPVTQEEWEKVMGSNPAHFSRNGFRKEAVKDVPDAELRRFPVEGVSFADVERFVAKLNEKDQVPGWVYRLPTENEWEYACRGGPIDKAASAFHFYVGEPSNGLPPDKANYAHAGGLNRTVKVGQFPPNRLGLHDMQANVLEWTSGAGRNEQGQETRFARGGSWNDPAGTAASHIAFLPTVLYASRGVRVARV
ncbi:MAG: SUMF1/EgtB/PvdO family nonheme iron enzyme, partial [Zavarzinella sp.]|nr:SUMF1/EgtB/PvdO family nonheme iron enzyme [Zavarzinella sp.]